MILSREIEIKITEANYHYYEFLGYELYIGESIVIPVELLPKGSHYKILCKCDGGEYYCRKCSEKKRKETLRRNFGVDYPIQNKKVHQRMKNTLVEKYGVDNISKKNKN